MAGRKMSDPWDAQAARIAELVGELGLMLGYFERGTPYWYGTSPIDRLRAVLEGETPPVVTRIAELEAALREIDFVVRTGVLPGSQNPPSYAVYLTKDEVIKWCGDAAAAALEGESA